MRRDLAVSVLLVIATLSVYGPVVGYDFVNFDDGEYVYDNPHIRGGLTWQSFTWAFTTLRQSNWHPLTWLSHMLDCQLFGLNAGYHHLVNVLLHAANSVLLYVVLRSMTGAVWRSGIVAALFALHPLHVESVAWVSERKDVLSTLFFLLTLWAYARYVAQPHWRRYALVCLSLALGLLAKPMLVTVPFLLLLLDYWPLGRFHMVGRVDSIAPQGNRPEGRRRRLSECPWLILEKIPLFALVGSSILVTFIAQRRGGAVASLSEIPMIIRFENACVSYVAYVGKMLWPRGLAVFYPYSDAMPTVQWVSASIVLAAVSVLVVWAGRRWGYLAVGWLWYLGTLVPVIGLVQVGDQSMADRYTYVPLIGLFLIAVWGAGDLMARWPRVKIGLLVSAGVVIFGCLVGTWIQVGHWKSGVTLFEHALEVTKNNAVAHNNLGNALKQRGRLDEAVAHYRKALLIKPDHSNALLNLGTALHEKGKPDQALQHYKQALQMNPNCSMAYNNWGVVLTEKGQHDLAITNYRKALEHDPENAKAHSNLGLALMGSGKPDESLMHCREGVRLRPNDAVLHYFLGVVLTRQDKGDTAIAHLREALRINPEYTKAHNSLGFILARQGKLDQAIAHFRKALALDSGSPEAHKNLALALAEQGKHEEAIEYYREAIRLNPEDPHSYNNLAWIRATHPDPRIRNGVEAVELADQACKLLNVKDLYFLDTLAAAYAEAGRFPEAVATQEGAISLAASVGPEAQVQALERRLLGYRAGRPYRQAENGAHQGGP